MFFGLFAFSGSPSGLLQANARGVACAAWTGGPGGGGSDCVWHQPPYSSQPAGSVWFGSVDAATGECAALAGVTEAFGNMSEIHGNFATPDASRPRELLAFVDPDYRGFHGASVTLPPAGEKGAVAVDAGTALHPGPPAWIARGLRDSGCGVLAWSLVETICGGALNVTESLSCLGCSPPHAPTATLWTRSSADEEGRVPPAAFGGEHAVDHGAGVLYTQSENASIGRFDLRARQALPRLDVGGRTISCLHFDAAAKRLGGIARVAGDSPSDMELVSIDVATGAVSTRLNITDFPMACTRLSIYEIDASHSPGDIFSPASRPACSFDADTGVLAFLLVATDAAATPAFSLEGMYVSTVDTRAPSKPSAAVKVDIPFVAAEPLGNRTWRVTEPSLSYL